MFSSRSARLYNAIRLNLFEDAMPFFQSTPAFETARRNMVLGQLIPNRVSSPAVLRAMSSVPRELFVPDRLQSLAYADEPVVIREGTFLFEPLVAARLILLADAGENDVVLNAKAGTGYTAALFSGFVKAVIALEADAAFCETAQDILMRTETDNAAVLNRNPDLGFPSQAPYDVVFVDGIVARPPEALIAQLADGGRMVYVESKPGALSAKAGKIVKKNGVLSFTFAFDIALNAEIRLSEYKNFVFEEVS